MQKVRILAVGGLKERALAELAGEYVKRLGKYCSLEISEVRDESISARESEAGVQKGLLAEAGRLLERLKPESYVIALDMRGKAPGSPELAAIIDSLAGKRAETVFVIGGSHGLHRGVLARADYILSMSNLTFPHQLARLILLEQLYRSYKIINRETYHK